MTLSIERTVRPARIHVAIRLVLLLAVGMLGVSSLYWVLYLALPAIVALLVSQKGGERYLGENAPTIVRGLRWLAGAYAYLWLLTDEWPGAASQPVQLTLTTDGIPSVGRALLRLLQSLPALLVLAILSCVAGFLWLIGALAILFVERLPGWVASFLEVTLRYQFRLIAYHLSLTDAYPSLGASHVTPLEPTPAR